MVKKLSIVVFALLGMVALNAQADVATAQKLADKYTGIAKGIDKGFTPSAEEGKKFFNREVGMQGRKVSCASCHTANPADNGKHIITGKLIRPLAPSVNAKRFTDLEKVEDKFVEHCNDITGSDCTAQEKANFITYLISVKASSAKK
jgi:mono/diheme cytochrome c family protein